MLDTSSSMSGLSTASNMFSVILKIHGSNIHLKPGNDLLEKRKTQSFKLYCHDLDLQSAQSESGVKVFVLKEQTSNSDKSVFLYQQPMGQSIGSTDLAIFMTPPIGSSSKTSYAIDLGVSQHSSSLEDLNKEECRKIGTAYVCLDPKFSTQGTQRMQIISAHRPAPIGSMQVDYLIVKNPAAYGVRVARPDWVSRAKQFDAGHRGSGSGCRADLSERVTENTVASFNYAARHGADMCELDVMCTADGVPVVYHNYLLDAGKPGVDQIDQVTLKELRNLTNYAIHDKDCIHNRYDSNNATHESCKLFPTLEEVLKDVDQSCALNIELKWAQLLPNGQSEAAHHREINDSVDRILNCIFEHSNGRKILLSTFNADIAIMLRLKQSQYPVLFLTTGDSQRFHDPVTKTIKNAIHFAQAFDLAGINPNAASLKDLHVKYAQDRGLLVFAWGKIETPQAIKELKRTGLNGVIYDKIDLIKPQD